MTGAGTSACEAPSPLWNEGFLGDHWYGPRSPPRCGKVEGHLGGAPAGLTASVGRAG